MISGRPLGFVVSGYFFFFVRLPYAQYMQHSTLVLWSSINCQIHSDPRFFTTLYSHHNLNSKDKHKESILKKTVMLVWHLFIHKSNGVNWEPLRMCRQLILVMITHYETIPVGYFRSLRRLSVPPVCPPENRQTGMLPFITHNVSWILLILGTALIGARIYHKIFMYIS